MSFFGPSDEYVASGSDCGHCFIWDKECGDLLQVLEADKDIVNCIEPHPHEAMTLATSGLENDCKIWQPTATQTTVPEDMCDLVARNVKTLRDGGGWQVSRAFGVKETSLH